MIKPPTERQIAFLQRLIGVAETDQFMARRPTRQQMSERIDGALEAQRAGVRQPQPQQRSSAPTTEPGYYVQDGNVFVVVESKAGRHYAKRLVIDRSGERTTASWQYVPGAVYSLGDLAPLTAEEAARLGHLHGFCVVCAKQLTVPASVEAGIGPVCRKRLEEQAKRQAAASVNSSC